MRATTSSLWRARRSTTGALMTTPAVSPVRPRAATRPRSSVTSTRWPAARNCNASIDFSRTRSPVRFLPVIRSGCYDQSPLEFGALMVFFNYATMQMAAKIVYYGPGLCGKTTNLHYIYQKTSPQSRGEMVSLETETDRTLFFDLLPIDVGVIGGFKTRLQLYTIPGQVFYNTTRKLVLKGVDGLVFVADSQRAMLDANVESFKNLRENLAEIGLELDEIPLVLQLNKRDLPSISGIDALL